MYRIDNRPEAIKRVQEYLAVASDPEIFVAPTGVFDENTRLSVIYFQKEQNLTPTGVVDYATFVTLYDNYLAIRRKDQLNKSLGGFITFPLKPGDLAEEMMHINRMMRDILDHYGFTHSVREGNFYSEESQRAVEVLRKVYGLDNARYIDEELYVRMTNDLSSISKLNKI